MLVVAVADRPYTEPGDHGDAGRTRDAGQAKGVHADRLEQGGVPVSPPFCLSLQEGRDSLKALAETHMLETCKLSKVADMGFVIVLSFSPPRHKLNH